MRPRVPGGMPGLREHGKSHAEQLTRDSAGYLPIEGYAAIGNGETVALVAADGSIDWCCLPRFDSPIVLGRLLDSRRGGSVELTVPGGSTFERSYLPSTNILQTVWRAAGGAARLTDFMPPGRPTILRIIEGLEGRVPAVFRFVPGVNTAAVRRAADPRCLVAETGAGGITIRAPEPWLELPDGAWECLSPVAAGQSLAFRLDFSAGHEPASPPEGAAELLARAKSYWTAWAGQIGHAGPSRDLLVRSALALKLLVHQPTGALVAAATTSLPEVVGGSRNWDYRFVWLRDSSLMLDALMRLGLHDEAMGFWSWIERLFGCCEALRIMYTVDGSPVPDERVLTELQGYRGSAPVRVGNGAAQQLQLDVHGYVLDAAYVCQTRMRNPHPHVAPLLRHLADEAAEKWRSPDQGIWEMRDSPRHFLHSKLMCWVALDRAVKLHQRGWLDGDAAHWARARDEVRHAVLSRGFSPARDSFTQVLGGDEVDASSLLVPIVGFLPGDDPRVKGTIAAVERALQRNDLVFRYLGEDGLRGGEGAFVACSFWLVEALVHAGRRKDAAELFARLVERGNDVGLFAEQLDPSGGAFLGNFPQAFSHLALIRAGLALEESRPAAPART